MCDADIKISVSADGDVSIYVAIDNEVPLDIADAKRLNETLTAVIDMAVKIEGVLEEEESDGETV